MAAQARGLCGVLVVDKPAGLTSFGVVKQVRAALQVHKAGHTGTLDPLATGVLPVCLGEATRIAGLLLAEEKAYEATARLGLQTDTLDITGEVVEERGYAGVERRQAEAVLAALTGVQQQRPPAYSALKVQGQRAYALARQGKAVELAPRRVEVLRFELRRWAPPELDLYVACSKGTYVRSLVDALGRALGTVATLSSLRRVRSGSFDLTRSVPLAALGELVAAGGPPLWSMDEALAHLPAVEVDGEQGRRLRSGQPVDPAGPLPPGGLLRVRAAGALIALGEQRQGKLWPRKVFSLDDTFPQRGS